MVEAEWQGWGQGSGCKCWGSRRRAVEDHATLLLHQAQGALPVGLQHGCLPPLTASPAGTPAPPRRVTAEVHDGDAVNAEDGEGGASRPATAFVDAR
jgi:hypothetical protein